MTKMDHKWVALLRGVNVGGANKVPMADLRARLTARGLSEVQSYIASGNLVFGACDGLDLEAQIADEIEAAFGLHIAVRVIGAKGFRAAVHRCPFEGAGQTVHGVFCWQTPAFDKGLLASLKASDETLQSDGDIVWLHAPSGIGRSKLMAAMERVVGTPFTARNLNTLRRLAEMAAQAE